MKDYLWLGGGRTPLTDIDGPLVCDCSEPKPERRPGSGECEVCYRPRLEDLRKGR